MLDGRNLNSLWASALVATLVDRGVTLAVVAPGSRSTPLAVALAQHPAVEAIPVLDERSAAFFALGHGKRSGRPAIVICTSGTAGANFYPAVIEAHESRVPLLILTADRPPEMRQCHVGQTIDQLKLYGNYPHWQAELALPDLDLLPYLQQTVAYAWERTLIPEAGPVHLNLPFRDPLPPIADPRLAGLVFDLPSLPPPTLAQMAPQGAIPSAWQTERGLIIAGIDQPIDPAAYSAAVHRLAASLGWPVIAEGLSPLRHAGGQPIATYDQILRRERWAKALRPEAIIQLGDLPTSKELRRCLQQWQAPVWLVAPSTHNHNALHLPLSHWRGTVINLAAALPERRPPISNYDRQWQELEGATRQEIDRTMAEIDDLKEVKLPWLLSQHLPAETLVFVANSMPIRDVEWFWTPSDRRYQLLANRGTNGIDGTLSTALGSLHGTGRAGVLVTGDLSFLYDTNGLLLRRYFRGSLKVLLINNGGGGIFAMLPIAQFDPPFREFFTTPQGVDCAQLCAAYQIPHRAIGDWSALVTALAKVGVGDLETGLEVWEIATDFNRDTAWRQQHLPRFAPQ